jgi:hypothetical protein
MNIPERKHLAIFFVVAGVLLGMAGGVGITVGVLNRPPNAHVLEVMGAISIVIGLGGAIVGNYLMYKARIGD